MSSLSRHLVHALEPGVVDCQPPRPTRERSLSTPTSATMPEWVEVTDQRELDEALASPDVIPACRGSGEFTVAGRAVVRALDSVRLEARGAATVEAVDEAEVSVHDTVTAGAWGRARVEARDNAVVEVRAKASVSACDGVRVAAWGWASVSASGRADIDANGASSVDARDDVVVRAWRKATVQARDSVFALAGGSASVTARGSAVVKAWDSARVDAGDAAEVEAWEAATVAATGSARVKTWGAAGPEPIDGAAEWCDFYGVRVEDGIATVYKAVDDDFRSQFGFAYAPGSEPQASDWNGSPRCGGGLHFSPAPWFALELVPYATRFVACPVRIADMVLIEELQHRRKVKAPAVCAPVYEVDLKGDRVERTGVYR
jgi:hypothetical protein